MRSLIAAVLAALFVAAHAPAPLPGGAERLHRLGGSGMACCGAESCCVHAHACATGEACALTEAASASARAPGSKSQARICVGACGGESARLIPGTPDPGTLEPRLTFAGDPSIVPAVVVPTLDPSTRTQKPADPPPRA